MPLQQRRIDEVGSLYDCGIESRGIAAGNGERDRVGFELSFHPSVFTDVVQRMRPPEIRCKSCRKKLLGINLQESNVVIDA